MHKLENREKFKLRIETDVNYDATGSIKLDKDGSNYECDKIGGQCFTE